MNLEFVKVFSGLFFGFYLFLLGWGEFIINYNYFYFFIVRCRNVLWDRRVILI